jgi:hypothetical protein
MTRKIAAVLTVLLIGVSLLFAQEKKDTAAANSITVTQQITAKPLAKQSKIVPKPQSNWTKIKDLFM